MVLANGGIKKGYSLILTQSANQQSTTKQWWLEHSVPEKCDQSRRQCTGPERRRCRCAGQTGSSRAAAVCGSIPAFFF